MKLKIYGLIALFSLFAFSACRKEITEQAANSKSQFATNPLNMAREIDDIKTATSVIGTMHGEALDYAYQKLYDFKQACIANNGSFNIPNQELADSINSYIIQYVETKFNADTLDLLGIPSGSKQIMDQVITNNQLSKLFVNGFCNYVCTSALDSGINAMVAIGQSTSLNSTEKLAAWDSLLDERLSVLDTNIEQIGFASAIYTAKNSYLYWADDNNYNKWIGILNIPNTNPQARSSFWSSDAYAALGGAIEYGGEGAFFGPGAAIVAGITGGIACGASASAGGAVWDVFCDWIGWR